MGGYVKHTIVRGSRFPQEEEFSDDEDNFPFQICSGSNVDRSAGMRPERYRDGLCPIDPNTSSNAIIGCEPH
jgi:hypothetical protein